MLRFYIGLASYWAWSIRREVNVCDRGWRFHLGKVRFGAFFEPSGPLSPIQEIVYDALRNGKGFARIDPSEGS